LCYAFRRSRVFNSSADIDVDARMADLINMRSMNAIDVLLWVYPRLIPLEDPETVLPLTNSVLTNYPIALAHMVDRVVVWIGENADQGIVAQIFGDELSRIPELESEANVMVRKIVHDCWALSGRYLPVQVMRGRDRRFGVLGSYLTESPEIGDQAYERWYRGMYAALAELKMKGR